MPADLVLRSPWNLWARGVVRIQPYLTAADDVRDNVENGRMKEEVEAASAMKLGPEALWRELEAVVEEGEHAVGEGCIGRLLGPGGAVCGHGSALHLPQAAQPRNVSTNS